MQVVATSFMGFEGLDALFLEWLPSLPPFIVGSALAPGCRLHDSNTSKPCSRCAKSLESFLIMPKFNLPALACNMCAFTNKARGSLQLITQ